MSLMERRRCQSGASAISGSPDRRECRGFVPLQLECRNTGCITVPTRRPWSAGPLRRSAAIPVQESARCRLGAAPPSRGTDENATITDALASRAGTWAGSTALRQDHLILVPYMDDDAIPYAVSDGIATSTPNRSEKLNALTGSMVEAFINALDRADDDDRVRAVVVTGAGRAFCAGADISAGAAAFDPAPGIAGLPQGATNTDDADKRLRDAGGLLTLRMYPLPEAADRCDPGAGGGCRRFDDAGNGRALCLHRSEVRVCFYPARDRA